MKKFGKFIATLAGVGAVCAGAYYFVKKVLLKDSYGTARLLVRTDTVNDRAAVLINRRQRSCKVLRWNIGFRRCADVVYAQSKQIVGIQPQCKRIYSRSAFKRRLFLREG